VSIKTGKIEKVSGSKTIKTNGKIELPPQNTIFISVPLGGYLKDTKLAPGMYVKKGEIIATIEDQQFIQLQQDYLLTKAKLKYLESEYQRQKEMGSSFATSAKNVAQAEAEVVSNKIMLKAYEEKLKLLQVDYTKINENNISKNIYIHAPANAFVTQVNANIGKYIVPAEPLFELIVPDDMYLEINVFEKDFKDIAIGQKVYANSNTNPDKKYECTVYLINRKVADNSIIDVLCRFKSIDKELVPGMYMSAAIEINTHHNYVIDEDAVVNFDNKSCLFVAAAAPHTYELFVITSGNTANHRTEIINGEQLIDKDIVVEGAYTLLMAMKNKEEE
jgi:cobalt-zinc-cadmium efflux system membrane fusion protein